MNCIQEGLVPTKYYEETIESLRAANVPKLKIKYKLSNVNICNQGTCFKTTFLLVKDLSQDVTLGTPFIGLIQPFTDDNGEIKSKTKPSVCVYIDRIIL